MLREEIRDCNSTLDDYYCYCRIMLSYMLRIADIMNKEELIKILENYEMFFDDDFGESYESDIAYAPDKNY